MTAYTNINAAAYTAFYLNPGLPSVFNTSNYYYLNWILSVI